VLVLNKIRVIFAVFISSILLLTVVGSNLLNPTYDPESFYVGVTYCGESAEEAKLLIDRVKNYTNLFVLQSGMLQEFPDEINEICDYAVSSGMYFIVYFGTDRWWFLRNWLETCEGRWGDRFLGIYYGDELGGKMIDHEARLWDSATSSSFLKYHDSRIQGRIDENTTITYWHNGRIELFISETYYTKIDYYPNGTIIAQIRDDSNLSTIVENSDDTYTYEESNGIIIYSNSDGFNAYTIVENYNVTYTYDELWDARPFQTYDETAEGFIEYQHQILVKGPKEEPVITALIADYALYWFDYKAGYDVVLANFGWNHTLTQDIVLVRGAAEMQNKEWGAIITWKYNHPPYLDSGEAIHDQMRTAYEAGAEYVVIFNYAEDMEGPYGTLQEEHFMALERFWNEVVQSPEVEQGSVEAEAVLVLPENYGWGMRNLDDKIWGLWGPDEKSQQIWDLSRNLLEQYGLGLDIIYDDPEFPVEGKYVQTIYWNQTN